MFRTFNGCAVVGLLALAATAPITQASYIPNSFMVEFPGLAPDPVGAAWYRNALAEELSAYAVPFAIRGNFSSLILASHLHIPSKYESFVQSLALVKTLTRDVLLSSSALSSSSFPASPTPTAATNSATPTGSVQTKPPLPMLSYDMTGFTAFRRKYPKLKGQGIKIGIIDSGIDYHHPAFGNCYKSVGCRIQYGQDFVGDLLRQDGQPISADLDPLDTCLGHGTNVAGILTGNDGVFQGVAPEATLGIYRVLDCQDRTTVPIVTAALEKAQQDGMQIINLSVGFPSGFSFDLSSSLGSSLAQAGIAVVSAAGNSGSESLFMNNSPATGIDVVSVASVEPKQGYSMAMYTAAQPKQAVWRSPSMYIGLSFDFTKVTVVLAKDATGSRNGCAAAPANQYRGRLVLVTMGTCDPVLVNTYARQAGAVGVLFWAPQYGRLILTPVQPRADTLPTAMIDATIGQAWTTQLTSGRAVTITTREQYIALSNPQGGYISDFSSWGPSSDLVFKPDIAAPGNMIYTTTPLNLGSYALSSGTSMASPFVAGCLALLKQHRPDLQPSDLKMSMMSSAEPIQISKSLREANGITKAYSFSPAQQGAGVVNMARLFDNLFFQVRSTLSYYDLTSSTPGARPLAFYHNIRNRSKYVFKAKGVITPSPCVTSFSSNGTFVNPPISKFLMYASISNSTTFTLGPGATHYAYSAVKSTEIPTNSFWVVGGHIKHILTSGSLQFEYHLPFTGMMGTLSSVPILPPPSSPLYPRLFNPATQTLVKTSPEPRYTMNQGDVVTVRYYQQFNVQKVVTQAGLQNRTGQYTYYDIPGGTLLNQARDFGGEKTAPTISWNGAIHIRSINITEKAPPGRYRLRI
ncbi:hypothetical protein IWQ60_010392, partial [Tieghemiomyces parasiticus]